MSKPVEQVGEDGSLEELLLDGDFSVAQGYLQTDPFRQGLDHFRGAVQARVEEWMDSPTIYGDFAILVAHTLNLHMGFSIPLDGDLVFLMQSYSRDGSWVASMRGMTELVPERDFQIEAGVASDVVDPYRDFFLKLVFDGLKPILSALPAPSVNEHLEDYDEIEEPGGAASGVELEPEPVVPPAPEVDEPGDEPGDEVEPEEPGAGAGDASPAEEPDEPEVEPISIDTEAVATAIYDRLHAAYVIPVPVVESPSSPLPASARAEIQLFLGADTSDLEPMVAKQRDLLGSWELTLEQVLEEVASELANHIDPEVLRRSFNNPERILSFLRAFSDSVEASIGGEDPGKASHPTKERYARALIHRLWNTLAGLPTETLPEISDLSSHRDDLLSDPDHAQRCRERAVSFLSGPFDQNTERLIIKAGSGNLPLLLGCLADSYLGVNDDGLTAIRHVLSAVLKRHEERLRRASNSRHVGLTDWDEGAYCLYSFVNDCPYPYPPRSIKARRVQEASETTLLDLELDGALTLHCEVKAATLQELTITGYLANGQIAHVFQAVDRDGKPFVVRALYRPGTCKRIASAVLDIFENLNIDFEALVRSTFEALQETFSSSSGKIEVAHFSPRHVPDDKKEQFMTAVRRKMKLPALTDGVSRLRRSCARVQAALVRNLLVPAFLRSFV